MKTFKWKILSLLALLSINLMACNNDEPNNDSKGDKVEESLGKIPLGDSTIVATVVFNDNTLTNMLTDTVWTTASPACILDNGDLKPLAKFLTGTPIIHQCRFIGNGKFVIKRFIGFHTKEFEGTWIIKEGIISLSYTNGDKREITVIGINNKHIICDTKYFDLYLETKNEKWFNPETAMFRYVLCIDGVKTTCLN